MHRQHVRIQLLEIGQCRRREPLCIRAERMPLRVMKRRGLDSARAVAVERLCAPQDARYCVIVGRGDGIEFVIVAARAGHGETEHAAADRLDLLVDHIHAVDLRLLLLQRLCAQGEETGGREQLISPCLISRRHQIACDLLADELIVRLIIIE